MRAGLLLMVALVGLPVVAQAQTSANAQADVSVTVYQALALSAEQNLDFGIVTPADGLVEVAPTEAEAGRFEATGEANSQVVVNFPGTVNLEGTAGEGTLVFTAAVAGAEEVGQQATASPVSDNGTVTMSGLGAYVFWLGGTVDVSGAAAGTYDGTFTLTVAYP